MNTAVFCIIKRNHTVSVLQFFYRKCNTPSGKGIRTEINRRRQLRRICIAETFRTVSLACLEYGFNGNAVILFLFIRRGLEIKIIAGRQ